MTFDTVRDMTSDFWYVHWSHGYGGHCENYQYLLFTTTEDITQHMYMYAQYVSSYYIQIYTVMVKKSSSFPLVPRLYNASTVAIFNPIQRP